MSPPVYLITGVSRGIGLEWVDDLVSYTAQSPDQTLSADQHGAQTRTVPDAVVIGVARNPEKAPKLQELASSRKNLHIIKGDVTSTESVEVCCAVGVERDQADAFVDSTSLRKPRSSAAANWIISSTTPPSLTLLAQYSTRELYSLNICCIRQSLTPLSFRPLEDYISVFDINVIGTIRMILAALPLLRAGSKKVIFNVSSFIGSNTWLLSQPDAIPMAPYCVSKAALNMFNSKLAKEVEKEGIITVSVSPGYVDTDMNKGSSTSLPSLLSAEEC